MKKIILFLLTLLLLCGAASAATVIPGGGTIGLSLTVDGAAIVSFSRDEPKRAGLECGDVITAVSQNPGAIGYASVASVKDTVKALSVGGVAPTEETIQSGDYVVQRPFVLVTKNDTKLSKAAQQFFDYITSADANEIISAEGVVPAA